MTTVKQPSLPPEGTYGPVERQFIDLQPPDLWPTNQNSNFGQLRKVFTDILQDNVDELTTLWNEMFPDSSVNYLSLWEEELGIPVDTTKSIIARRANILAQRRYGGFTRSLRNGVIELFLQATFGDAIQLTSAGVAMSASGVPLYGDANSIIGLYRVYEDVRNFSYEVWIKNTVTPNMAELTKRLNRLTPAGIVYTTDNSKADVLDYFRLVRNGQPVHYIRDNGGTDVSGYGLNGTVTGVTALAAPGLLHTNVAGGNAGLAFNGTTNFISVADAGQLDVGDAFTWEAIVNPSALPTAGNYKTLATKGAGSWQIRIDSAGVLSLWKNGAAIIAASTVALATGTTYHVAVKKQDVTVEIRINGVNRTGVVTNATLADNTSAYVIGQNGSSAEWFAGGMDEVAYYNYFVSDFNTDDHNSTRQDIPTY